MKVSDKKTNGRYRKNENCGLFGNATDYRFYHMSILEIFVGAVLGGVIGAVLMFLFFRFPVICAASGTVGAIFGVMTVKRFLKARRDKELLDQFKSLLESLATSFGSGKTVEIPFRQTREDMRNMFPENSYIVREIDIILLGMNNGRTVETMLGDFAVRSGLEDIETFVDVFVETRSLGGDMYTVVDDARSIIIEKIDTERDITTELMGLKGEFCMMLALPIVVLMYMNLSGGFSIDNNSFAMLLLKFGVMTVLGITVYAGSKILNIKA